MNGYNVAEAGHVINVLPPVSISGGKTGVAFSMKGSEHVSIVITFGVMGSLVPTAILLNQCTAQAGTNATAMPFRWYAQALGGAGNDVLAGPNYATASGITSFPTTVANTVYVLEVDAAELEAITDVVGTQTEYPYLQLQITDSGNVTIASATAVLSGLRYAYKANPSQTV